MLNISEVLSDPDFYQSFTVKRSSGEWQAGEWVENKTEIPMGGVVTVAGTRDIQQVPEGDRVTGMMCFHVAPPHQLHLSQDAMEQQGVSDMVSWRGKWYKLIKIMDERDYGYQKAIGVQAEGER